MRIIILAPPGGGKGTQAQFIIGKYGIPHISTGHMLRIAAKEQTKLGRKIKQIINIGELISDELITSLVKDRLKNEDCRNGFLLDGIPRNISQAHAIQNAGINIDYVLELVVPDIIIINRIIGRRVHINSGRIYNIISNPPKLDNIDDITGEPLVIRQDDQEDIIRKRLIEYNQQIKPLINYYYQKYQAGHIRYYKIDGTRSVYDINVELMNILNNEIELNDTSLV